MKRPSEEMNQLLRASASTDVALATRASIELAVALTVPLKQGVLRGDIVTGIFEPIFFEPGTACEFPLDLLAPGTEQQYIAYTIPNQGRIPEKHVEGDYLMVPTYDIGASMDWHLKFARDARWDVVGRAMQVLEGAFTRKRNADGWHTLLAAGVGRGLVGYDDAAQAGLFTKRLIALMKTIMRRQAGGNSTSLNRGKLTDVYVSPESLEDIRSWDLTQVDDFTRREIFLGGQEDTESPITKIFNVTLHDIDEIGVGQEYQNYYLNTLGGTLPASKTEVVVGLDLSKDDSFVNPIRAELQIFEDMSFHRQRRASLYGWMELGWTVLDNRRVLIGAL